MDECCCCFSYFVVVPASLHGAWIHSDGTKGDSVTLEPKLKPSMSFYSFKKFSTTLDI